MDDASRSIADPAPAESARQNCQGYTQAVIAYGQPRLAYGTACQDDDGSWQVASVPSLSPDIAAVQRTGGTCREFQQPNVMVGEDGRAYGTACQQANGVWRFVSALQSEGRNGRFCRAYEQDIIENGRTVAARGMACAEPDGAWRIITAPTVEPGAYAQWAEPAPAAISVGDSIRGPAEDTAGWEVLMPAPYAAAPAIPPPLYSPASPGPSYNPPRAYGRPYSYAAPARAPIENLARVTERASVERPLATGRADYVPERIYRGRPSWSRADQHTWRAARRTQRKSRRES